MMFRIISQDKKSFVKLGDIIIDKINDYPKENSVGYVISSVTESFSYKIGIYSTEERALEILDDIEYKYVKFMQDVNKNYIKSDLIFEMPKE